MDSIRIMGILGIVILIANLILFAFGKISNILFWIVIICCAIVAYAVIPRIKKQ